MKIGIGIGVQFSQVLGSVITLFNWGSSTPTKTWGTATTETWG